MRWAWVIALVMLSAPLTGCIADDDPSPTSADQAGIGSPSETPDQPTSESQSPEEATNETTSPDDGSNATEDAPEPDPEPPLPQNLSIEAGEVVERTPTSTVFAWNASTPTGVLGAPPPGERASASTTFDVPAGAWLEVNATLTWENPDADLGVRLARGETEWCSSASLSPASDDTREACELRPRPRPSWEEWSVEVTGFQRYDDAPGAVDFSVELSIEAVDGPWASAPSRAPSNGWVAPSEAEIRPGARVVGGDCTSNFLFTSLDRTRVYLGTAAHCVDGLGIGAPISVAGIEDAGRLAYCSWGTMAEGRVAACPVDDDPQAAPENDNDLALVEIDPGLRHLVNPSVKGWGGPTGLATNASIGDNVLTYGNSSARDAGDEAAPDPVDPREGYVCGVEPWQVHVALVGPSVPGDSGSPVLDGSGRALGVMRSMGGDACPAGAENAATKLAPALVFMEEDTDLRVQLETWSLQQEPRLPGLPVG